MMHRGPTVELVGRAAELALIGGALEKVERGTSQVLLLEGEAGIGKSALAAEAVRLARQRGFMVYAGAAVELDRGRPFSGIAHALGLYPSSADHRSAAVAGLILRGEADQAGTSFADVADPLLRIIEGVAVLLEQDAARRPVCLALEDLHWADSSSLLVFRSMARRLEGLPILLLGTLRPVPHPPELAQTLEQLRRDGGARHRLGPLDEDHVADLARNLVRALPGTSLMTLLARAGGNPLFVVELLRALDEERALELVDGRIEVRDLSRQPAGFRSSVLQRLRGLSAETQHVLRLAAVLGATFSLDDLALVADRPPLSLLAELHGALEAGVVGEAPDGLRFRHDLIRDTIYEDMPAEVRGSLHREIARLLASHGAPAPTVAQHLALGAQPGDLEAVAYLREAARPGRAPARVAADLLELAARLAPHGDGRRDELDAELAEALLWAGRVPEGERLARQLMASSSDAADRRAHSVVLRALWVEGRWGELAQHAEALLRRPDLVPSERGHVLADSAIARLFCGEDARAEAEAREALAIGEREGDELVQFHALYSLPAIKDFRGPIPDGVAYARRSLALGRSTEAQRYHPHFGVGMCLHSSDDMLGAEESFRAGQEIGHELGTVWDMPLYQSGLAIVAFHTGRWDDAVAGAETSVALADEVGTRMGTVTARAFAARIALHRDDLERAEALMSEAQRELDSSGPQWGAQWLMLAQAELHEARGRQPEALDTLMAMDAIFGAMIGVKMEMAPHIVRVALASGRPAIARSAAESVQAIATRAGVPRGHVAALRCRGIVDGDVDMLLEAVGRYRDGTRMLERGELLEDAGTVASRMPRTREDGVGLLTDALSVYERLGALRDAARTLSKLRELGVRRGQRGPRGRPISGWESVTQTERRVAALVAEGLSNREIAQRLFISRYTVETHLKHLFVKLGLASRAALAREATRRGDQG